jgi:DNA ligase-1
MLLDGREDLRPLPFIERRSRLETAITAIDPAKPAILDLSGLLEAKDLAQLDAMRQACQGQLREGLMLKRRDSPYQVGRPRGAWFKWKRDPLNLDCVLMYAQRGHGRRSSFYSDYTFGAWRPASDGGEELVPVGKAYFGFTDEELTRLDKWVRDNTLRRYGPVREVRPGLVLEIGFDSVHRSTRHKSGVAMRFPRVLRIRWDKRPDEADRLPTLEAMIVDVRHPEPSRA